MNIKSIPRRIAVMVAFVGVTSLLMFAFTSGTIGRSVSSPSVTQADIISLQVSESSSTSEHSGYGIPLHITIPKINLVANVESVGLTKDGAMDVPKAIENVAWFNLGSRPGEIGDAVIGGHYGWKDGKSSAFDNLHDLQKGDVVLVSSDNGKTISFMVREVKMYPWKANSDDVFISSDGKSHLNLITCEGVWNKADKSYSNRLVVFTDKLE